MKLYRLLTVLIATTAGLNTALAANAAPTIVVHASGEASATPNQAILELGVSNHASTAQAALASNNNAMHNIIIKLLEQHIAKENMQTSELSLYETNDADKSPEKPTYTYNIESRLTILVKDLSQLAKIYDTAIAQGANQSGALSFSNSEKAQYLTTARAEAVQIAREKAATLAKAAGVKLGEVLNITESPEDNYPLSTSRAVAFSNNDSALPPIQSGQIKYKVGVTISFAIKP